MRKRALGKGIEALIPGHDDKPLYEGYSLVSVHDITPNPYQPRIKITEEDVRGLITYILAAGERRFRAAQIAGFKEVPVVIRDLTDQELLEIGIIENLHRKDLNPVEEARAYTDLHTKFGMTHDRIAQLVGKDRSTVTNVMRIMGLPDRVRQYLAAGKLSSGHARALLSIKDEAAMIHVAERIIKEDLSVRAAETLISRLQTKSRILPGPQKEANLLILEDELSKLLNTKVTIEWKRNRGTVTIHYYSLDDFTRIHEILKRGKKA
jgi:ParB family chromosome partitioning protein